MRDYKFRGKPFGEWVTGYLVVDSAGLTFIAKDTGSGAPEIKLIPVDKKTVGWFTGLKDKNGAEIYESDILGGSDGRMFGIVAWSEKLLAWVIKYPSVGKYGEYPLCHIGNGEFDDEDEIVILGNIYDNPSLLAGGSNG